MNKHIRKFGWLMAAGLLGAALIAPSAVFAVDGNQTNVSSEDYGDPDCTGGPGGSDITPGAGEVAWLFVHANPDSASGTLTANFTSAGQKQASSYDQGGVKYLIVTDRPDTLESFSDDISGGVLTLSHICYGDETTTTTSTDTETTDTETTDTETTDTETTSTGTEEEKTPPETDSISQGGPSTVSSALLLVFAGLLATALIVPAKARSRR